MENYKVLDLVDEVEMLHSRSKLMIEEVNDEYFDNNAGFKKYALGRTAEKSRIAFDYAVRTSAAIEKLIKALREDGDVHGSAAGI